jgi:hypothetical protein
MKSITTALVAAAMLAACSPGESPSAGGTDAAANSATAESFMGTWKVSGHIVAPWFTGPGYAPEPGQDILDTPLVLTPASAAGPTTLACDPATFEVKTFPVEGLFEGNVPDASLARSALGVEQDQTPSLVQTCTTDRADRTYTYHLIGKDVLLLGLDNIVYQFGREPA